MANQKRIEWIDRLKGISFYLVVLGHAGGIDKTFKSWIYSFHMPLFLMISGFNLNVQKIYKTDFKSYFIKNFHRLIVPYVWLQLLSIFIRYITSSLVSGKEFYVPERLVGIIVGQAKIAYMPSLPLYYILLVFLAQLALWLLIRITKGDYTKIGVSCFLLCSISLTTADVVLPWHINAVPVAMFFIFLGRLFMDTFILYEPKLSKMHPLSFVAINIVLAAIGFVLWKGNGRFSLYSNFYGNDFILSVLAAVFTGTALTLVVSRFSPLKGLSKLFSYVGRNTLFGLGIHLPLHDLAEAVFPEQSKQLWFVFLYSTALYLILIPASYLANKFFPYWCGVPIREETGTIKLCKIIAVYAVSIMPYNYFLNHFKGGLLKESVSGITAAIVIFFFATALIYIVLNSFLPFAFLQKGPRKKEI